MTCKECRNALPALPGFTHQVFCNHYHLHTGINAYAGDCNYFEKKQQTRGDRIRAMSDEQLADFLDHVQGDAFLVGIGQKKKSECMGGASVKWLDWLREEVQDD